MPVRKSLFTILIISYFGSAKANQFNIQKYLQDSTSLKNNTKVTIKVNIKGLHKAAFYYNDEYSDTEPPVFLDSKDTIKTFKFNYPTLLIDAYHQIPFLVYPGETLELTVDQDDVPKLTIAGNNKRNNELYFFLDYYKKFKVYDKSGLLFGKNHFSLFTKDYSYKKMVSNVEGDSLKRFNFLKNYKETFKVSFEFESYAYSFFKYLYVMNMLSPLTLVGIDTTNLPYEYTKQADNLSIKLTCDSCLVNEAYRRSTVSFSRYICRSFIHSGKKFSLSFDTISNYFTGATRRYALFILLKDNMTILPPEYDNRLNDFLNEKTDLYSKYLEDQRSTIDKFKSDQNSMKELASTNGDKLTWDELLKKNRGRLIYLDFWASWCVPCRQMIPLSYNLEKSFSAQKIVFVYISIDDSPANWQKAASDEHIDSNRSYFLVNQKASDLKKRFKIKAIPRYMLINSDGVLVDVNAPYPNNLQIKKLLSEYMTP
ncbi:MAG TPA: TlpA disulfide reductase family protein [Mucilaginibacter sp.]|jgi:thiol-disulfide isomerase/thioredoxin